MSSKSRPPFLIFLRENVGFSLVEVMVAVGLTGIVSMGVVSMIQNTGKMQADNAVQEEIITLRAQLINTLRKDCTRNLVGKIVPSGYTSPLSIVSLETSTSRRFDGSGNLYPAPTVRYNVAISATPTPGNRSRLNVTDIVARNFQQLDNDDYNGTVDIVLRLQSNHQFRDTDDVVKRQVRTRYITHQVNVTVDPISSGGTGAIVSCNVNNIENEIDIDSDICPELADEFVDEYALAFAETPPAKTAVDCAILKNMMKVRAKRKLCNALGSPYTPTSSGSAETWNIRCVHPYAVATPCMTPGTRILRFDAAGNAYCGSITSDIY